MNSSALRADRVVLGGHRNPFERAGATARGGRRRTQRGVELPDSPSLQAFQRIGEVFHEFDSDSAAMVVLEGDQPLGAEAHTYYDELVKRFEEDTRHRPARVRTSGATR